MPQGKRAACPAVWTHDHDAGPCHAFVRHGVAAPSGAIRGNVSGHLPPSRSACWAAAYLLGLLRGGGRKTAEGLARTLRLPPEWGVRDAGQALQHFLNQSPWDEEEIWQRRQTLLAARLPAEGLFVVSELAFAKQGRHSVGVQRQYSSALGGKRNCQVAVALSHLGLGSFVPLALRLYLPRGWLQDAVRLEAAGVPLSRRHVPSKASLALEMLDQARAAGVPGREVVCFGSPSTGEGLAEAGTAGGLTLVTCPTAEITDAVAAGNQILQEKLGLGHFEGRSWRGFHHHACLVMLAHDCLLAAEGNAPA